MAKSKPVTGALGMDNADVLAKVRGYYESAVRSSAYQDWLEMARKAWDFYDGQQWTSQETKALHENGQPAIVINKIASKVDNVAGGEVNGRTRILYRSRSGAKDEEATARAMSDVALYIAERNDQAIEISNVFRAGLVTGIGWLDVGVERAPEGPFIFNRAEDELSVVWDPTSRRLDMSDARFVCRERWLSEDEFGAMFPDHAEAAAGLRQSLFSYHGDGVRYIDAELGLIRVVEVQYFHTEKSYDVTLVDGTRFQTFDKKEAKLYPEATVVSRHLPRAYVAYFTENTLLAHVASPHQHQQFSLVPYVFKRRRSDGVPYGIVQSAMDPQRELNKRRSKAMHLLNTAQVIADVDAVEDPHVLAKEAARPDGLILKRPGKELRILRNSDLAQSQVAVMEQAARDIQDVMGVYDETQGKESNATSGIAIRTRQMASTRNQMFAFDALRRTKKALGYWVLALMRQYFTAQMVIQLTDQLDAPRMVRLNEKIQLQDGREMVRNDVRSGTFDVVVEEVRDAVTSRELDLQQLELLMKNGVPVPQKMIVESTNLRNKEEILKGLEDA